MTDIAGLSFSIDTSSVPPAIDQLNKLSDATDHVRASTRFLVGTIGDSNEALAQLATSGRASLSSFVQISQNLDTLTQSLTALRGAAAQTIGTLGGQAIGSALTTFQQQFQAMATVFGTTSAQLEAFNKQAEYLSLNSYQVTSALQRITAAQQNQTSYGQAIRGELTREGINIGQDPAAILRAVQEYAASHQQSQDALNVEQSILGPIDPATQASLLNQPYKSVDQRRQEFLGQTLDKQASETSQQTAQITYQNQYNRAAYEDGRQYLGEITQIDPGGTARRGFLADMPRQIAQDEKTDPEKAAQERRLLEGLQGAQSGSQNAIAFESQYDILNPNDPFAASTMSPDGRAAMLNNPISGTPTWYQRATDRNFQNANTNYIGAAYDARRANVGNSLWSPFEDFALNTDEISDTIANRFGFYQGPPTAQESSAPVAQRGRNGVRYFTDPNLSTLIGGVPAAPTLQNLQAGVNESNDQKLRDADVAAQQFGLGGFQEALAAETQVGTLQENGINSTRAQMERQFARTPGFTKSAGDDLINQQIAAQNYVAAHAATPGFDTLEGLRGQDFAATQPYGQDITTAFLQFYKNQGLDAGRLMTGASNGRALSMSDLMAGQGGAGVALTPAQIASFQAERGQLVANSTAAQQTQFGVQSSDLTAQLGLAQTASTPADYQVQLAGLQAYQDVMKKTGDTAQAMAAQQDAATLAMKNQEIQATLTTKALQAQNDVQAKAVAASGAALATGQPGAYGAATAENQIQAQVSEFSQHNPADAVPGYEARLRRDQQTGLVTNVQGAVAQVQNQVFSSQATLSTFGQGIDARNREAAELQFADQLKSATGDNADAIRKNIDAYARLNDQLDRTNQALSDLQAGMGDYQSAAAIAATRALPPSEQEQGGAFYRAQAQAQAQSNTATPPAGAPGAPNSASPDPLLAPLYTNNNPFNLKTVTAHPQPGVVSTLSNGVAVFDNPQDGMEANLNQIELDQGKHGDKTLDSMLRTWNPPNAKGNSPQKFATYEDTISKQSHIPLNAPVNLSDPKVRAALVPAFSTAEGTTLGAGQPGDFPGGAAYALSTERLGQQSDQLGYARELQQRQAAVALPLLQQGRTGDATMAQAHQIALNVPGPLQQATVDSQLTRAADQLTQAATTMTAGLTQRASDSETMAQAYLQGPSAVNQAQANLQAQAAQRQFGAGNPAAPTAADYLQAEGAREDQSLGQAYQSGQNSNALRATSLNNNATMADPYMKEIADSNAKIAQELATTYANASQTMKDNYVATQQTATQLDIIGQKQAVVQQGMNQIGGSVGDTLSNMALSYQHGPGAGIYARQQLGNLFNSAGRSLFSTAISPITNSVSGNLTDLVDSIMGYNAPNSSGSPTAPTGSGTGGNGTGSATSQALGTASGALGSVGNMFLTNTLRSLGTDLFGLGSVGSMSTASLIAHQGGAALAGAETAGAGASSAGWLSSLFAALANGGEFSGGQRVPFANGGIFDSGLRRAFAGGDTFTDPTTMPMALLGEAGPEAIMPLSRGADGKLGIAAGGGSRGGSGPQVVVNAPITIGQNALGNNGQMSQRQQMDLHRQMTQTLTRAVKGVMADQSRPGGMIQPQG